jgi:hypothetical protein
VLRVLVVQHGLGLRETWLPRTGSRLESQYGGPMALIVLEGWRARSAPDSGLLQKPLQCGRDAEEMAFIIPS